jgi:putative zinc finger/helix-turn-helix YgiT family protein
MTTTKCPRCGEEAGSSREARFDQDLPDVILDPLEVIRCPSCGESVIVRRVTTLHAALRDALLRKPDRLTGREARFLREGMGWSSEDAARHLGIEEAQIQRWERDEASMDLRDDRTLRVIVAAVKGVDLPVETLAAISDRVVPLKARATLSGEEWLVITEPERGQA